VPAVLVAGVVGDSPRGKAHNRFTAAVPVPAGPSCVEEPWSPECKDFKCATIYESTRCDAIVAIILADICRYNDAAKDIGFLCLKMPAMCSCEVWTGCQSKDNSGHYCDPFSVLADVCVPDGMAEMSGCSSYNKLCVQNSTVQQCHSDAAMPNFLPTSKAKSAILSMCSSMGGMPGCDECTKGGKCATPLESLGKVCRSMSGMAECQEYQQMCDSGGTAVATFCGGRAPSNGFCTGKTTMCVNQHVLNSSASARITCG
jgi:hypothetical protein